MLNLALPFLFAKTLTGLTPSEFQRRLAILYCVRAKRLRLAWLAFYGSILKL